MLKPAIAIYLGETYASLGLFDRAEKTSAQFVFEKSVFLPQVSIKNLLLQTQAQLKSICGDAAHEPVEVYIVTRFLDRLKQFRLGGSISQVVEKGFENSYGIRDSNTLSLAASQLIISVDAPFQFNEDFFKSELERVKKINPDLNKVVISLSESMVSDSELTKLIDFFNTSEIKVFRCTTSHIQGQLRRTLLNAGSDGTKEELNKDIHEIFGAEAQAFYFVNNQFQSEFENTQLYHSSQRFLATYLEKNKLAEACYFDIESWIYTNQKIETNWDSPWGNIPIEHNTHMSLGAHPFSELKLNQLSMLCYDTSHVQLEPGPVVAGRAIKPLVLDLFFKELGEMEHCNNLFPSLSLIPLRSKIENLFSALEKGQKNEDQLFITATELRQSLIRLIQKQIQLYSENAGSMRLLGPLAPLFAQTQKQLHPFMWTEEIKKTVLEIHA